MDLTALREEGIRIVLSGEEGSRLQERISLLEEPLKRCFRAMAREKTGEEWPLRVERRRWWVAEAAEEEDDDDREGTEKREEVEESEWRWVWQMLSES